MGSATLADILLNKKYWILHFFGVVIICLLGIVHIGTTTIDDRPPLCKFKSRYSPLQSGSGKVIIAREEIEEGQAVFLQRGFMTLGSFWGDGSERGPDFTADVLHQNTIAMKAFLEQRFAKNMSDEIRDGISVRVARELHENGFQGSKDDTTNCEIVITDAQVAAYYAVKVHHHKMFNDPYYPEYIRLGRSVVLSQDELDHFSAFLFWGAWVLTANRPGETYSYTHNWPYDPEAGNTATGPVLMWSVLSIIVLFFGVMFVLYVYGQIRAKHAEPFNDIGRGPGKWLTTDDLENDVIRPTQRATYPFFALAMLLFGFQILAGIICATDFVRPFGIFIGDYVPFSVARSYHTIFGIFWFFMCWVGYTIFFLPRLSKVPAGQSFLIHLLFVLCVITGVGTLVGIYLSHTGVVKGEVAYWFGSQGWEFMELGRFFQILLLCAFTLWIFIIYRGVKPWLTKKNMWSVPAWLLYGSGVMVFFLFFGLWVRPKSNFAVSNFWRWMVVHMWVEVTFEVFTTVIVAYMMVQMNFVNRTMAENTIFLAVMMFLLTATVGVAHNFYWIAKPTSIIALGSTFSTTQVLPLLLLTLDAWRMRKQTEGAEKLVTRGSQRVVMTEVWQYLVAVNFWNVFGAGVFGSLINLPIVNYYEHATYLTNNHAHGAMFGVKGNIALGGMLYCCQHLFPKNNWSRKLVSFSFWALNVGIALMMFMDLFPVGLYQLNACFEKGFWYARSHEIVQGVVFKTLTYFRSVGGMVFVFGGLLPLMWFVLSNAFSLMPEVKIAEADWPTYERNWEHQKKA